MRLSHVTWEYWSVREADDGDSAGICGERFYKPNDKLQTQSETCRDRWVSAVDLDSGSLPAETE